MVHVQRLLLILMNSSLVIVMGLGMMDQHVMWVLLSFHPFQL